MSEVLRGHPPATMSISATLYSCPASSTRTATSSSPACVDSSRISPSPTGSFGLPRRSVPCSPRVTCSSTPRASGSLKGCGPASRRMVTPATPVRFWMRYAIAASAASCIRRCLAPTRRSATGRWPSCASRSRRHGRARLPSSGLASHLTRPTRSLTSCTGLRPGSPATSACRWPCTSRRRRSRVSS
jgi:hypothetical protein